VEEAIQHTLLAGDVETAVQLFSENRHQIMNEDRWLYLERLLNLFPEEVVAHDPMLLITKAHVATLRSNYSELLSCLERARKLADDLPQDLPSAIEVQGEILTVQCIAAFLSGQIDKMIAYGQLAEERLPEASYYVRGVAAGSLMVGSQMSGDINRSAKVAGDLLADPAWPRLSRASIHLYLGYALWMNADLVSTKRTAYETLRLMKNQNVSTMAKSARYFIGAIFYLQNDLNRAEASLSTLLDNPASSPPTYLAHAACILSRIYCIQNRREEAQQILDSVSTLFEESANWSLVEIIRAFQVELALDQKNVIQAQQLGTSIDFDARPALWFYYIPQLTPTKLLYAQGTPAHLDKALFDLAQVEAYFHPLNRKTIYIDVLALQALVYEAQGKREEAVDRLQRSLELAASGGFIRNFVDLGQPMADLLSQLHRHGDTELSSYISRILAAFPVATVPSLPELDIRLSRREMEVLRFLATDLSPKEFALRMTISPATVRTHVRNIYAKLEVNRRIEAVHRAKELGLI
jgi:LuxR family maltose regulon positive regulatory protein